MPRDDIAGPADTGWPIKNSFPSLATRGGDDAQNPVLEHPADSPGKRPIVVSAGAFALVHIGQGPAPIPLFAFGLMLGFLYQRTHRLAPCVVAHMALNATSLLVVWAAIALGAEDAILQ